MCWMPAYDVGEAGKEPEVLSSPLVYTWHGGCKIIVGYIYICPH